MTFDVEICFCPKRWTFLYHGIRKFVGKSIEIIPRKPHTDSNFFILLSPQFIRNRKVLEANLIEGGKKKKKSCRSHFFD